MQEDDNSPLHVVLAQMFVKKVALDQAISGLRHLLASHAKAAELMPRLRARAAEEKDEARAAALAKEIDEVDALCSAEIANAAKVAVWRAHAELETAFLHAAPYLIAAAEPHLRALEARIVAVSREVDAIYAEAATWWVHPKALVFDYRLPSVLQPKVDADKFQPSAGAEVTASELLNLIDLWRGIGRQLAEGDAD